MNHWIGAIRNRTLGVIAGVVVGVWLCSACSTPGSVLPVVKIGLVAPFEGPQRAMAYDALFATKLALSRFNEQQRNAGGPLVELVALNDDGQAIRSRQVAQEMAVDPAIVGVIGPWSAEAAAAAAKTYREANLPVVYPGLGLGQLDTTGEPTYLNVCATDAEVGAKAAEYVAQQGPSQRIVVVAPDGALMTELTSGRNGPLVSVAVIADGAWHRVGFVRDGLHRILYVDDIEVARDTVTTLTGCTGGLYIGAGKGLEPGAFWSGLIDDVWIYNRAVRP